MIPLPCVPNGQSRGRAHPPARLAHVRAMLRPDSDVRPPAAAALLPMLSQLSPGGPLEVQIDGTNFTDGIWLPVSRAHDPASRSPFWASSEMSPDFWVNLQFCGRKNLTSESCMVSFMSDFQNDSGDISLDLQKGLRTCAPRTRVSDGLDWFITTCHRKQQSLVIRIGGIVPMGTIFYSAV